MIKYMKDPLNKEETAYDYFKKNSGMEITLHSDIKKIRKAYKETLKRRPEELPKAGEMWDICNTVTKRLKMDFFHYLRDYEEMR
ncbi:MAG: hypothetical protein H8E54_00770 [Candidatus Aminicenantes bacterium]|nr:hypothetical protein [Candidatus Aminicenantes bacterium]